MNTKLYRGIYDKSFSYGTLQNSIINYELMDLNEISLFHVKNISILSVEIHSPNGLSLLIFICNNQNQQNSILHQI